MSPKKMTDIQWTTDLNVELPIKINADMFGTDEPKTMCNFFIERVD
jgi:hypothetical protein